MRAGTDRVRLLLPADLAADLVFEHPIEVELKVIVVFVGGVRLQADQ